MFAFYKLQMEKLNSIIGVWNNTLTFGKIKLYKVIE